MKIYTKWINQCTSESDIYLESCADLWSQSPPYFCALTETVADLTNSAIGTGDFGSTPHRLEALADTEPPPVASRPATLDMDHSIV